MPRMTGLQATHEIKQQAPDTQVLILSMHDDERYLFEALSAGAAGYVLKRAADQDLVDAVRAAGRGEPFLTASAQQTLIRDFLERGDQPAELTPREQEVVKLIAEAHTNKEIARDPAPVREDSRVAPRRRAAEARHARPRRAGALRDPPRAGRACSKIGRVTSRARLVLLVIGALALPTAVFAAIAARDSDSNGPAAVVEEVDSSRSGRPRLPVRGRDSPEGAADRLRTAHPGGRPGAALEAARHGGRADASIYTLRGHVPADRAAGAGRARRSPRRRA